jgi:hypothetical protein
LQRGSRTQFEPEIALSDAQSIVASASQRTPVHAAIARAAQATGVDFNYLLAQAKMESSLDPSARASTSSAAGLYQFTDRTWANTLAKHGTDHGLGGIGNRAQMMALRYDPEASSMMAAELARDNGTELTGTLGRAPDGPELYLAHFLGIGGAKRFLSTLASNPGASAAAILPDAAAANRSTFYTPDGSARSVSQMMDLLRTRMAAASNGAIDASTPLGNATYNGDSFVLPIDAMPVSTTMAAAQVPPATTVPHLARAASMSDVLASTFGATQASAQAPAFVKTAYARLQAFGL